MQEMLAAVKVALGLYCYNMGRVLNFAKCAKFKIEPGDFGSMRSPQRQRFLHLGTATNSLVLIHSFDLTNFALLHCLDLV